MLLELPDLQKGTLLSIGAGAAPGLEGMLAKAGPAVRVVLVEPHPVFASDLSARFASDARVTVLAVAIGPEGAKPEATLIDFNQSGHSSLHPQDPKLHKLVAGLMETGVLTVPLMTVKALWAALVDMPRPLHLRLDAAGSERDILRGLKSAGLLKEIDRLDLRAGREPLYSGTDGAETLKNWALNEGFRLKQVRGGEVGWAEFWLEADQPRRDLEKKLKESTSQSDSLRRKLAEVEAALAERDASIQRMADARDAAFNARDTAKAQLQDAEKEILWLKSEAEKSGHRCNASELRQDELIKDLTTVRKEADDRISHVRQLESELATVSANLAAKSKEVTVALAARDAAEAKVADQASRISKDSAEHEKTATALKTMTGLLEEKAKAMTDLQTELAKTKAALLAGESRVKTLTERMTALDKADAALRQQLDEAVNGIRKADADRDRAIRDLATSLRVQDRLQASYNDLQDRFAATEAMRADLEGTLQRVTDGLSRISFAMKEDHTASTAYNLVPYREVEKAEKRRKKHRKE